MCFRYPKETVRQKILSAVIYLITAVCLWNYFDILDGLEPPRHPPSAITLQLWHLAIVGGILFGIASIVSIFSHRGALICGLGACLMSWPHFGPVMATFPLRELRTLWPVPWISDLWPGIIVALAMLLLSSL